MAGCRRGSFDDDDFGDFSDPFDSDEGFSDQSETLVHVPHDLPPKKRWQNAAMAGNLEELKKAKEVGSFGVDELLDGDWTALMYAASFSQPEIIRYLLQNGANVNYHREALTPLMCACQSTSMHEICNFASVKLLLDNKAKVDAVDRFKQTPLMKAIEKGKNSVASVLIPLTDLEKMDSQGRTAVFYAVEYNREHILQWLIDEGVQLDIIDKHKTSLKSLALIKNYEPVMEILKDLLDEKDEDEIQIDYLKLYASKTTWQQMFPNILDDGPAYFCDIPKLLHGMYCEQLSPLFEQQNVDLMNFLTMSDEDLKSIDVVFPYQRKLILSGLYKFHTHPWNSGTLVNISKDQTFNFQNYINYLATYLKYVNVMNSSMTYITKMINNNLIDENLSNLDLPINELRTELKKIRSELKRSGIVMKEINKRKRPFGDLIKPKDRSQTSIINKRSLILITSIILIAFTTVKLQYR